MRWGQGIIVAAFLATTGCYWFVNPSGPDVEEQAKEDLGCDHVEVRRVGTSGTRSRCTRGDYVVEGCGTINHYRCSTACDHDCRRLGSNELRSN